MQLRRREISIVFEVRLFLHAFCDFEHRGAAKEMPHKSKPAPAYENTAGVYSGGEPATISAKPSPINSYSEMW